MLICIFLKGLFHTVKDGFQLVLVIELKNERTIAYQNIIKITSTLKSYSRLTECLNYEGNSNTGMHSFECIMR
jgi:hypothetical protein